MDHCKELQALYLHHLPQPSFGSAEATAVAVHGQDVGACQIVVVDVAILADVIQLHAGERRKVQLHFPCHEGCLHMSENVDDGEWPMDEASLLYELYD